MKRSRSGVVLVAVLVALLVALCLGPADVGLAEVWSVLTGGAADTTTDDIVRTVRMPRVSLGLLVGAALSVSGVLFQALTGARPGGGPAPAQLFCGLNNAVFRRSLSGGDP